MLELLLENGADVDFCHEVDFTALHSSAANGKAKKCRFLLEKGATLERPLLRQFKDILVQAPQTRGLTPRGENTLYAKVGAMPLHLDADFEQLEACRVLLVERVDSNGRSRWTTTGGCRCSSALTSRIRENIRKSIRSRIVSDRT
jgi:hypothetical protein